MRLGVDDAVKEDMVRRAVKGRHSDFLLGLLPCCRDGRLVELVMKEALAEKGWTLIDGLLSQKRCSYAFLRHEFRSSVFP